MSRWWLWCRWWLRSKMVMIFAFIGMMVYDGLFFAHCFRYSRWFPVPPICLYLIFKSWHWQEPSKRVQLLHGHLVPLLQVRLEPTHQVFLPWYSRGVYLCFLDLWEKVFSLGSFSFCKSWTRSNGYGKRKRKNGKKEKFWKTRKNPKLCKISHRPPWRSTTWPNGSPNLRPTPPRPWAASSLTLMGN